MLLWRGACYSDLNTGHRVVLFWKGTSYSNPNTGDRVVLCWGLITPHYWGKALNESWHFPVADGTVTFLSYLLLLAIVTPINPYGPIYGLFHRHFKIYALWILRRELRLWSCFSGQLLPSLWMLIWCPTSLLEVFIRSERFLVKPSESRPEEDPLICK